MPANNDIFYNFIQVALKKETYLNLIYLILMLPLGCIYFTVVVTGFSVSLGLIFIIIGIFIAILFLLFIKGLSSIHLSLAGTLLGFELPQAEKKQLTSSENFIDKLKTIFTDIKTYTSMLYMIIELPLGIFYFTLIITLLSISISFALAPILWILGDLEPNIFYDTNFLWDVSFEETLLLMIGGVFLFFVTLHLGNVFAKIEELLCKNLLTRI